MSLLDRLSDPGSWQEFYEYKTSLACPKEFERELKAFMDARAYLPVCESIAKGERFPLPRRAVISKLHSQKKRTVYIYPPAENTVLKLLTWLLLRTYDGLFSDGLYSFRPGRSAKDAIRRLTRLPGIRRMYAYKVDISNYFNSIPVRLLLPMLREAVGEDAPLCVFLERLLEEEEVLDGEKRIREQKGIMAGTPLASFYANLYLKELDRYFAERQIPYARYSDDIIVFADSREGTEAYAETIRRFLSEAGLTVNPSKEQYFAPQEGWTFLGFAYKEGEIDIAPVTVAKLKAKMRRKTRALLRWSRRNGVEGEKAAAAFIRIFNRKLLENAGDSELTWSCWFFSVINTTKNLRVIDEYARDCIRTLAVGTRTKARFNLRYDDMKKLGYRNLVHAYYEYIRAEKTQENRRTSQ
ncbi:MAG: group II intron reverse transcriptase domain-containing protein [Lachnospiraceae bacterium]|nr:group II intron reverse transcriptase domain-containing protein [Lachnospiraceae bacterium]